MADDPRPASPKSDPVDGKEDADTTAARKELKHTTISEKATAVGTSEGRTTPDAAQEDELKDLIASPKKKRGHDQLDDTQQVDDADTKSVASSDSAKDRAARLEPEKKRHRDEVAEGTAPPTDTTSTDEKGTDKPSAEAHKTDKPKSSLTSGTSFGGTQFAKLSSSSASPFGSLGGAGKTSVFGGAAASPSPFASASASSSASASAQKPAAPALTPTLSFGGPTSGSSPFASAAPASNGFGSAFGSGGGFGSALSGKPLTSFAKPGSTFKSEKPTKPFGAPDSDAEDDSDKDEEGEGDSPTEGEDKDESDRESTKGADEKKKRLQKVTVDDGETGEVTVLAVRAKIYHLDKDAGWRERGSGMLKINVPESSVEFEDGAPVPGSFDASGMEDDGGDEEQATGATGRKVVRLLMRQDNTHRMLLNTVVFPALEFKEKAGLKAVGIIFTAFEGDDAKPVSIQAKMSAASAKSFFGEIGTIQRELASN